MSDSAPSSTPAALRLVAIARCAELIAALRSGTPGILSVTVATADGLTVGSTLTNKVEADKLAAMSGSISALAAALTRETGHGQPERVLLESDRGQILSMSVPGPAGGLVLTVVASKASVLGTLLWSCRQTADRLAEASTATA